MARLPRPDDSDYWDNHPNTPPAVGVGSFVKGFTIVELLIVIVIIGILAAIVIILINGAQQRAENAKTIDGVSQYYKALVTYASANNQYPPRSGTNNQACLGEGYSCDFLGVQDTTFNSALRTWVKGSLPPVSTRSYAYTIGGSSVRTGAAFYLAGSDAGGGIINPYAHLDGVEYHWFISYVLGGVTSCGSLTNLASIVSGGPPLGGWPNYSRTPPGNGRTEDDGKNTYCTIWLPDPGAL